VKRQFVDIAEGQVHVRRAGQGGLPLLLLHVAPGTAAGLDPLTEGLGRTRACYALDCLGMGDSSPPAVAAPDLAYFADATRRTVDALGLSQYCVYGNRGGAHMAIELAITDPSVQSIVIDGLWHFPWPKELPWTNPYPAPTVEELHDHYAPALTLDAFGSQFRQAWHLMRDSWLFWPSYARQGAHRRTTSVPEAAILHDQVVELLKGARTQHLGVRAAFRHDWRARAALVRRPTLALGNACPFIPGAIKKTSPRFDNYAANAKALEANVAEIAAFLDGGAAPSGAKVA